MLSEKSFPVVMEITLVLNVEGIRFISCFRFMNNTSKKMITFDDLMEVCTPKADKLHFKKSLDDRKGNPNPRKVDNFERSKNNRKINVKKELGLGVRSTMIKKAGQKRHKSESDCRKNICKQVLENESETTCAENHGFSNDGANLSHSSDTNLSVDCIKISAKSRSESPMSKSSSKTMVSQIHDVFSTRVSSKKCQSGILSKATINCLGKIKENHHYPENKSCRKTVSNSEIIFSNSEMSNNAVTSRKADQFQINISKPSMLASSVDKDILLKELIKAKPTFRTNVQLESTDPVLDNIKEFEENNSPDVTPSSVHSFPVDLETQPINENVTEVVSNVTYSCEHCSRVFKYLRRLEDHKLKGECRIKLFDCLQCNVKFKKVKYLKHHVKLVHERPTFQCTHCSITCRTNVLLQKHIKSKHVIVECIYCGGSFNNKNTLRVHQQIRCKSKILSEIGKEGINLSTKSKTKKALKPDAVDQSLEDVNKIKVYRRVCKFCQKIYHDRSAFWKHKNTHEKFAEKSLVRKLVVKAVGTTDTKGEYNNTGESLVSGTPLHSVLVDSVDTSDMVLVNELQFIDESMNEVEVYTM